MLPRGADTFYVFAGSQQPQAFLGRSWSQAGLLCGEQSLGSERNPATSWERLCGRPGRGKARAATVEVASNYSVTCCGEAVCELNGQRPSLRHRYVDSRIAMQAAVVLWGYIE